MKLLNNEEVIWKSLGSLTNMKNGKYISERDSPSGDIPVVSAGKKPTFYTNFSNCDGNVITIAARGTAGHVMYFENPIYLATAFSIQSKDENKILTKFIYYFLKNNQKTIYSLAKGGAILQICTNDVENIQIPIPSLSEQQRIVDFLDKLTELQTELQTEHKLRKEQYAYYRDLFLGFDNEDNPFKENVVFKSLDKIFNIKNGYTPSTKNKDFWEKGTVPWFKIEDIKKNGRILSDAINHVTEKAVKGSKKFPKNSILFSINATVGEHALILNEHLSNQQITNFSINDAHKFLLKPKFVFYYFYLISKKVQTKQFLKQGTFNSVNMDEMKKILFPIPSLETQQKIVNILDKLEEYANGLNSGLPKLMELEKQRFDYYLNYLMNFKE